MKQTVTNNRKCLYLCLAYSATIGSTASLASNGPNLVLKRTVHEAFGDKVPLEYATWLALILPAVVLVEIVVWLIMRAIYLRKVIGC